MNYSLKTRVLSMILVVALFIGIMPISAFATTTDTEGNSPVAVIVKFDVNGGIGEYENQEVTSGNLVTKPDEDPTHETSTFAYWTTDLEANEAWNFEEDVSVPDENGEMILYASWITSAEEVVPTQPETAPNETIPTESVPVESTPVTASYTVEHMLETADGYALDETATETLAGEVGALTAAVAKEYKGYTAISFEQSEIAEDGSTVVQIFYSKDPMAADVTCGSGLESLGMDIITNEESTLAPGVTMNEIVLYDANGKRVEMQLTTSDTKVDTVHFYANYKDNQNQSYGLQTLSEQVAAMEANYEEPFKVVAGLNASYYNTTTGKPTGAFVMEGNDVTTESEGNQFAFFAVLKDGTVMIGDVGEYSKYKGQIKEAIGGYVHILKDGVVKSGLDKTTKYPRQTIGITADGKVITMTADGSQTQTVGLTYQEQAEVMLALGCVDALHLDGGNSATFGAVREGTDKFVTVNSPSGGAERAVSNTLMIVSTAVADGAFDHAVISGDYEYQLPNTITSFSAIGVDAANGVAEIPENAVWTLSDDSFGTIAGGVFVSNGKLGDVDVQLSVNGKVVGSKPIHVVDPTQISFAGSETTVPYGKTAPLTITAMYGNNEAFCEPDNFTFVVDPAAAGTMSGFDFTASQESTISSAVVTATYKHNEAVEAASITVKFGKGSEVLFDFEDGDISDWHGTETIFDWINAKNAENPDAKYPVSEPQDGYSNGIDKQTSSVFLATEENGGHVKSGKYALGFRLDHMYVTDVAGWLYNYLYYTGETKVLRDMAAGKAGTRIGMWVYSPDVTNVAFRIVRGTEKADGTKGITYKYMKSGYDNANVSYATNYGIPESGWIYVYYDLTDLADNIRQTTSLYDPEKNNGTAFGTSGGNYYPAFLQLFTGSATDTMHETIYYIDDITLDYSDVTEDRDAPVFSNTTVSTDGANDVALNGQTVNSNQLSFTANVTDASGNANATGLDYTTAKIYVDGIDMSGNAGFKAGAGIMSLSNVNLVDGQHSICFEIFDKQGNESRVTKTLTVDGSAGNAKVYIAGRNDGNHTPKAGSVYYLDIKTSDASQIEAVTTTLKLNTANRFEYQNIICPEGVTVTTAYDALDFEVTVTLTHDGTLSGEAVLASIPVRVWAWDEAYTGITSEKQFATTAIPVIDIEFKTLMGKVSYAGGAFANYATGFYTAMDVKTELDNKSAWHTHTAAAIDDKAATCTMPGYTGRTYCEGCASVIDWGTTVPATGHVYVLTDGILKCSCGKTFTGTWTDGKEYNDGVAVADGWVENSYYQNGAKLTGVHKVAAPDASGEFYYDFGDDGICKNRLKFEGVFYDAEASAYRYSKLGVLSSGWFPVENNWYYFNPETMAAHPGELKIGALTFAFEEDGKLISGIWAKTLYGYRYYYGPGYHKNGWQTIDGKDYFFENSYRVDGGYQCVFENQVNANWYFFQEDGSCDRTQAIPDGFHTDRNGTGYSVNGVSLQGVHKIDGVFYYFNTKGYAQVGSYGGYLFGEDYKGFTGLVEKNNALYYYRNGKPSAAGLVEVDGAFYFACGSNGEIAVSEKTYVWEGNGIIPESTREFGPDGKLLDGIVDKDGTLYYYVMGQAKSAGLVEVDGSYYFACGSNGEIAVNETTYVWEGNGIIPESTREFGADGKMLDGIVKKDDGYFYYEMGAPKMAGLIQIDGNFYFAKDGMGTIVTDRTYYVWKPNDLLPEANYQFDKEGKMRDGIVDVNGTLYYYVNGRPKTAGLVEFDGAYYFANGSNGEVAVGKKTYVWEGNGIIPESTREFGPDGKMLDGIVNKDGTLYYYVVGQPKVAGLVEVDGAYYFACGSNGEIAVSEKTYVWEGNGIIPESTREFGPDGKLLDGIVDKDGVLYYYVKGQPKTAGVVEVDGAYYFACGSKGEIAVDETRYVWQGNGLLEENNYTFGADGKLLNGFVTKEDGIYYYENGRFGTVGLNYIDGYYYFVGTDGKLVTSRTYYVWKPNGLSMEMNYSFDALGRAIL